MSCSGWHTAIVSPPCGPDRAPAIAAARLRRGNTGSARGAGRLLAQATSRALSAGVSCRVMVWADSAYYGWAPVGTALRAGLWFSVTARMTQAVQAVMGRITPDAWTPIKYPKAIFDAEQHWISDAQVAEIPFTAFTSRRTTERVTCRLVSRPGLNQDPPVGRAEWSHNWAPRWSPKPGRKPLGTVPCSWQAPRCADR